MAAIDCPKCGAPCSEAARFCRKCGWQIRMRKSGPEPPPAPPPAPRVVTPPRPEDDPGDGSHGMRRNSGKTIRYEERSVPPPPEPKPQPMPPTPSPVYTPGTPVAPLYTPMPAPHPAPVPAPVQGQPGVVTQALHAHLLDNKRFIGQQLVRSFALWAGGLTLMPVPFADLVFLIPIQSAMVLKIARVYDVDDPPEKVLSYIAAACGVSVAGQVTTVVVANLVPIVGKFVSAPLVYGWTYGLGEAAIYYFENRDDLDHSHMKRLFNRVSEQARRSYGKQPPSSAAESLDRLRENMSPEEFQELKRRLGLS
ncbi:MAG: hypothetical protein ACYCW6_19735 [Candidatus Xenobia bacterium]